MDSDLVKVLTGIRRSGKSVLLLQIQQKLIERGISSSQIIYLSEFCMVLKYKRINCFPSFM